MATQSLVQSSFPEQPANYQFREVQLVVRETPSLPAAVQPFVGLQFCSSGIAFVSFQENIDTSSPLGSAIFTIISAVAQLERDIIAERVKAGLRRAQRNGKRLGRPKSFVDRRKLVSLREKGLSLREIAKRTGVSKSTVANVLESPHS